MRSEACVLLRPGALELCGLGFESQCTGRCFETRHVGEGKGNELQHGKLGIRKRNAHSEGGQILEQGPEGLGDPCPRRC